MSITDKPAENAMNAEAEAKEKESVCSIVIGMAGTGKTTLMKRIHAHVHEHDLASYFMNLDPAVSKVPYSTNIDIRDTVKYKEVMEQYKLGPNGAIMTSLNLFATRFDQVLGYIEKKKGIVDHVFVDTPGQIEVFAWSASGQIITESLASTMPTVLLYIVDTPRSRSPVTFISNMLYAVSILYRTHLPFVLVFNKTDLQKSDFAVEWMNDFEKFADAIDEEKGYIGDLSRSMGLALEEFYYHLHCVSVSSVTGEGMGDLFEAIEKARTEYHEVYVKEQEERRRLKEEKEKEKEKEKEREEKEKESVREEEGEGEGEDQSALNELIDFMKCV